MASWLIEGVGFCASVFSATAPALQVVKILRSKDASGVSALTFAMLASGSILWSIFALAVGSPSILCCNLVLATLATTVLVLKTQYRGGPPAPRETKDFGR